MPGFEEVRAYLIGLWLLVKGNRTGFAYLDFSERGSLRSFWAIAWCLPPIVMTWIWIRASYLEAMPPGASAGGLYYFRLALSELCGWMAPILLTGLVTAVTGYGNRFNALVTAVNWLSVPFAYGNALLLVFLILLPGLPGVIAFLWLILLASVIMALERIFRMICGPNVLLIVTLILVQMVPVLFLSDWLEQFLGTAVP
jgi:hypothetical protein